MRRVHLRVRLCASALLIPGLAYGGPDPVQTPPSEAPPEAGTASAVQTKSPIERELEAAFWRGEDLFTQGQFEEAALSFARALELSQRPGLTGTWRDFSPNIALNVAKSHRRAGNCQAAEMAYTHYASVGQPQPKDVEWHEELLRECPGLNGGAAPKQDVSASTAENALLADPPKTSNLVPPNETPSGSGSWLLDVNAEGTARDARVPDDGETSKVWAWTTAGASLASLGAAVGFWVSGNQQNERAEAKRLWAEAEPLERSATTRWTISGVCAGAGLALGGVSVYLFTRSERPAETSEEPRLGLHTNGTELHLTGAF